MSVINSQLGVKDETTYGTAVTVDRFYQFNRLGDLETFQYRGVSKGIRSAGWAPRSDQQRVALMGGTLPFEMEWMSKSMGWWLKHLLGGTATSGPTDSAYTHTGTVASLYGDFFTAQTNIPFHPAGTSQPVTLLGTKVPSWELSCEVSDGDEGLMMLSGDFDAQQVVTSESLASASYTSGMVPYSWVDVAVTIGGTSVPISKWSLKCTSNLKTDRLHQRGSALKQEPTHAGQREFEVELTCDFDALTQWNRVRATVAANAFAQVIITCTIADTGTTIGSATQPSTTITIPKMRFDKIGGLGKEAPDGAGNEQTLSGPVLYDGSSSLVTIAYVSADSTA